MNWPRFWGGRQIVKRKTPRSDYVGHYCEERILLEASANLGAGAASKHDSASFNALSWPRYGSASDLQRKCPGGGSPASPSRESRRLVLGNCSGDPRPMGWARVPPAL